MGVARTGPQCSSSPTGCHYMVGSSSPIDRGFIHTCKYCGAFEWRPLDFEDAKKFSNAILKYGMDIAYQLMLDGRPAAKKAVIKLQKEAT